MIRIALALAALMATGAAPAAAQSMNVRAIIDDVMGEVCLPYARTGDIAAAVRAAEGLGYAPVEGQGALLPDRDPPAGLMRLTRRHGGTVTLELGSGRGQCAVGVNEGAVSTMAEAAGPHLQVLGLAPVLDDRGGAATTDIVVWRGGTTQVVISRSPHFPPGSELVLAFVVPD